MNYQCLNKNEWVDDQGYSLVPLREEDLEPIRQWRNAQIDILRQQHPISPEEQLNYYKNSIAPLFKAEEPTQILFSFLEKGTCIGYGGFTRMDWTSQRAELSFITNPNRSNILVDDFRRFLYLLVQVGADINLRKLVAETYSFRRDVLGLLESFGFQLEGILRNHVVKNGIPYDSYCHGYFLKRTHSTVLITSISKKVSLIQAVRNASTKLNAPAIHGCDINGDCIGRFFVDAFWQCAPIEQWSLKTLLDYCDKFQINIIIPTRDGDLSFLAQHRDALKEKGIQVMVSSSKAIELCTDKLAFAEFLKKHNFPFIPTFLSVDEVQGNRIVVKSRYGAGARQGALDVNKEAANALMNRDMIAQPFIEGEEFSIDLYRDKTKRVKGCVVRKRDLVVCGESQITTTESQPEIEQLASKLADALDLYGHAVIQVLRSSSGLHIVECNPRFGGASTASIATGLDSFLWFLQEAEKIPVSEFKRLSNIKQVRYATDDIQW